MSTAAPVPSPNPDLKTLGQNHPIWAARAQAIQMYAHLEQTLCLLLAVLIRSSPEVSAIIFFKIVNTGQRLSILDKILRLRYGTIYVEFWNSYEKMLRPIDVARNEIVHWNAAIMQSYDSNTWDVVLTPPTELNRERHPDTQTLTTDAINEFGKKCEFLSTLGRGFVGVLRATPPVSEDESLGLHPCRTDAEWGAWLLAWRDICQQPVVYPPPSSHPICQMWPEPRSLLRAFLEK